MNQPQYFRPSTITDALELMDVWGDKARIMSGGTDLLVAMRRELVTPEALIDITQLEEMRGITRNNNHMLIGALTTHHEIGQDKQVLEFAPSLAWACRMLGSLQIRNRGTIGGNIGNASPAGDTIPPLFTMDAEIGLRCVNGERWIPVEDFFTGPGTTLRQPNEIITGVRFITLEIGGKCFFNKIGQRRAVTISKVSAAGFLQMEGQVVHKCLLALGAAAPTVVRLRDTEELLRGKILDPDLIDEASELCGNLCSPINNIRSTIEYRCAMSRVLIGRGLKSILEEIKHE